MGGPGRAPGRPKRGPERQNARQRRILTCFFTSFFHVAFCIRFWSPKFGNDLYRTLENKRFASTGARFSQNRFFRLATEFYRKITSKTLRFESPNRKNSQKIAALRSRSLPLAHRPKMRVNNISNEKHREFVFGVPARMVLRFRNFLRDGARHDAPYCGKGLLKFRPAIFHF